MAVIGIRGLVGQVYTIEDGVLNKDDSGALIPLSGSTSGFYYIMAHVNYLTESAACELKVYKSKAKFKNKPGRPYQIINFTVKNQDITTEDAVTREITTTTYKDFDTWFADDVTKTASKNEQRRAVEMLKTFTGSSEFEIRNNITNICNCTTFIDTTITNAD